MNSSQQTLHYARHLAGKSLLKSEIPFTEIEIQTLLEQKLLMKIAGIARSGLSMDCSRCFNNELKRFGKIPCALCNRTHYYCRNCIQMGRMMECEFLYEWAGPEPEPVWEKNLEPLTWSGELSYLQSEAADVAVAAVENGQRELLLWAVCGAGKTEMLFRAVAKALTLGKRVCLASPRTDVIRELLPRFKNAFSNTEVHALYGGSPDKTATGQLLLSTTHQLLRFREAFDVMIIDEVDAFPYHNDILLHKACEQAKKQDCTTIYLTATPRQMHLSRIKRKNLPHHFVPCRFHGKPLPVPKMMTSLFLQKSLKRFLPPNPFFKWLNEREDQTRQLLIFVPTIRLADAMCKPLAERLLAEHHISSSEEIESVHAEDSDREDKVLNFRSKKTRVLMTTTILERGVTFPSVDVAVIDAGHEVFDEAALVQIAGRAGRSPDDPDGEVRFFHDGRTDAMVRAIRSIEAMNRRAGF